jgi:hypothetical protein
VSVPWRVSKGWMAGWEGRFGIVVRGFYVDLCGFEACFACFRALQNGEQGWEEGELDAGDGWEAEEAVFDLGGELGVGGFVG